MGSSRKATSCGGPAPLTQSILFFILDDLDLRLKRQIETATSLPDTQDSPQRTRPFPGSLTYLVRNIDARLKALPKCLQRPRGLDWLWDHLLQPLREPGEHTAPHTARGKSRQARGGWQQRRAPPAPCPQLKPKIHGGCKRSTSQTPMLMRGPPPQALQIPLSFQFLQHQQEIIIIIKKPSCHHSACMAGEVVGGKRACVSPATGLTLHACAVRSIPGAAGLPCWHLGDGQEGWLRTKAG